MNKIKYFNINNFGLILNRGFIYIIVVYKIYGRYDIYGICGLDLDHRPLP